MYILGINAFHGDASACLLADGKVICAIEEERLRRVKHWAGFPSEAVTFCLASAGISIHDVGHVAINRLPGAHGFRRAAAGILRIYMLRFLLTRLDNRTKVSNIKSKLAHHLGVSEASIKSKFHYIEHHLAHISSSFFVSKYGSAAALSVDGFGDFVSTALGIAERNRINIFQRIYFPHSLGIFYQAFTQFLGFENYGDEYKVMGLAPYGVPRFADQVADLIVHKKDGRFALRTSYFLHSSRGVEMSWEEGSPVIGQLWSEKFTELFGPARTKGEPIEQLHKDIAASVQLVYESNLFRILNHLHTQSGLDTLLMSGGCAMNSVANGKIIANTPFKNVYIPPAPGDAGGAIGAAYYVWNAILGNNRADESLGAYLGPNYSNSHIHSILGGFEVAFKKRAIDIDYFSDFDALCEVIIKKISDGAVVGWFQGCMEWGPRALGNRSILADPRRANMKEILNSKIKMRESFRPFAPSVLKERVTEWFDTCADVPFMSEVHQVKPEKRHLIPAVTHVDGSGRLQSVSKSENERYHALISKFYEFTDVPMLLNTSFNENEPIVCHPREAIDCFLRTRMDVLVLGDFILSRTKQ